MEKQQRRQQQQQAMTNLEKAAKGKGSLFVTAAVTMPLGR
jgi:hypothetical protein